ncbi:aldose 1-epimerase [Paenibacillus montanisoli]|uniref:Aldose 1-epimerase n=1 Tax=Paenibacillus montanisoli TaxID=2081970 RepID=A0A328U1R7_9BACL|nr:aldose 1-epimerase [Paenibacillus montanisoli]RAP76002.1 aldose 1-epimerase [Paenibacillus montanisoli]
MSRYSAECRQQDGFSIVVLTDSANESVAELLPEVGNNLYRFTTGGREVIKTSVSMQTLKEENSAASKYGTPILFPPNRIRQGQFEFRGRSYNFPINEPPDYHLHGELIVRPWEVVDYGASDERGAWVTSRLRYADYPEILAYFPHELTFTITYRLAGGKLYMDSVIHNEGDVEAPFAYGLHPYFSLPYESDNNIRLQIPALEEWPITNLSFVTGRPAPTDLSNEIRQDGIALGSYPELGCTLLTLDPNADPVCRIALHDTGYTIAYGLDQQFPYVLLFRPNWDQAFSIEPYTYVTDAFNLPYEHELTGVRGLQAGEECRLTTALWIEESVK